jgi:ferredoxin-NADP reductase
MSATKTTTRRILSSRFVDLLVGPHGVDRYLELIRPNLTLSDARAEVVAIDRQTPRSVTLTLRPNVAWRGFRAGQFVRVGVEIDGVRRTRTYSPASSEHRRDGLLELTATTHPEGLVSNHLRERVVPGTIVHLGAAQGRFTLPGDRPERLVLISGGSGITPVLSMLRTLSDEGHDGEVVFLHYARTRADLLYVREVEALVARRSNMRAAFVATRERERGRRVSAEAIGRLLTDPADGLRAGDVQAAVCGPPALIDAVREIWAPVGGADRVLAETFTPPTLALSRTAGAGAGGCPPAGGTLQFLHSDHSAAVGDGTLLEQAEAAGLTPDFGCRMGICHTCTCRKSAGAVRNLLTGEVSSEEDEDIQLCISVPAGDVALEI